MITGAHALVAAFDRFVPTELTETATRQRCQLIVLFSLTGALGALAFAITGHSLNLGPVALTLFAAIAVLNALVPFVLRATTSPRLAANIVAAMWFAGVASGMWVRGGLDNPASMAIAPLPLLATVLAGWRSALLWTICSAALLAMMALAPTFGFELIDHVPLADRSSHALASAFTLLVVLVLLSLGVAGVMQTSREAAKAAVRLQHAAENRAQMLRAGRLAALGEVASSLAHEINNPLMYVMANLEFIGEGEDLPDEVREAVTDAHDGSTRIASIVRDLKAYASSDDGTIEPVDLTVAAQSTARLVRGYVRRRAKLVLDLEPCPPVDGNWAQFGQVLINLVVNASHAIGKQDPEGNQIRIATGVENSEPFLLVEDTGCGIAEEDLERVTEPFFTSGLGSGTGLGLTVTRNIVEELGGRLEITSKVGEGTSVRVLLPASSAKPRRERRITLPATLSNLSVLLVDDDPLIAAALGRMLIEHTLIVATSIDEARARVAEREPDLILLDVPSQATGATAWFEELEATKPELAERTVLLSGGAALEDFSASLAKRTDRVALKPIGRDELRELIYRFVRDRTTRVVEGNG